MKAIVLEKTGPVENLQMQEIQKPTIRQGEVLVKVVAISINPVDYKTRQGSGIYKYGDVGKTAKLIIGWDISGVVEASQSDDFKKGDEVFGMVNFPGVGAAYAEYVAAPAAHLALKPAAISHDEAAAATLAALTALQTLVKTASVKQNDRVLILAASGGVGHYAVQIAKSAGAYVIGTSSAANRDFVLGLGADEHIDYHATTLTAATKDIDIVLDTVGGENILKALDVVKHGGRIISIVTRFTDEINAAIKAKQVEGGFMLVQSDGNDMKTIASMLASGTLKSHISSRFAFEDMGAAHLQQESGRTVGKIVVKHKN